MNSRLLLLVSFFLAMTPGVSRAQGSHVRETETSPAQRKLEVNDYFRIKDVADAQISPEGKWVAYTVKSHDPAKDASEERIWMAATSGGGANPSSARGGFPFYTPW